MHLLDIAYPPEFLFFHSVWPYVIVAAAAVVVAVILIARANREKRAAKTDAREKK